MSLCLSSLMCYVHLFVEHILPCLSILEMFRLRSTCRQAYRLVEDYLKVCHELDLSVASSRMQPIHFEMIITKTSEVARLKLANCKWIDETRLTRVSLAKLSHLQELDLSSCRPLSNAMLIVIAHHCPSLTRLSLRDWHSLDGQTVSVICERCARLERLNVSNCWLLGDKAVADLARVVGGRLKCLDVSNLYSLTDASMHALSLHCHGLVSLHVAGCWRLTDHSIRYLLGLGDLCRIDMRGCSRISLIGVRALMDARVGFTTE